jgi:hypothetical protein
LGLVAQLGQHDVGMVDPVAGAAEVRADRAVIGATRGAVLQEHGGLRMVGVCPGGSGVDAQMRLKG